MLSKRFNRFATQYHLYLFLSIIFAIFILLGSITPEKEVGAFKNSGLNAHLMSYFMLSLTISLHLLSKVHKPILKAALLAGSYGLLIELIQFFIPYKDFEVFDIFINFTGAFLIFPLYFCLRNRIFPHYFLVKLFNIIPRLGINVNRVSLEASSMCQLKCPICPTGKGLNKKGVIGLGYLKFKDFKKFVDDNPNIKNIELSNYGEIFLNPELKYIIKYAYNKNIKLTARNGVNLNNVSKEILEHLVKYKFRVINVSIDGATNETYKIYRKGGNFNTVIENIKRINRYKKKYGTKFPKLLWQFVIMGHNEHELPIARKKAKELGMIFKPKLNWDPSFSPVKNKEFVRRESGLGIASREEFKQKTKKDYVLPCIRLWVSPQINWDGKLLGCCCNTYGDFGVNVFELGLKECLSSKKYVYAKEMLMGRKPVRKDMPCSKCPHYSEFLKTQL